MQDFKKHFEKRNFAVINKQLKNKVTQLFIYDKSFDTEIILKSNNQNEKSNKIRFTYQT